MKSSRSQGPIASRDEVLADVRKVLDHQGLIDPAVGACTIGRIVVVHAHLAWPPGASSRDRRRRLLAEVHGLEASAIPDPGPPDLVILIRGLGPDAGVPAKARVRLQQESFEVPRLHPEDLEGITLRIVLESDTAKFIETAQTDASGLARISRIPPGARCKIELAPEVRTADRSRDLRAGEVPTVPSGRRKTADASSFDARRGLGVGGKNRKPPFHPRPIESPGEPAWPTREELSLAAAPPEAGPFEPVDSLVTESFAAIVKRDGSGVLWLTIITADSALANKTFVWECGPAHASLKLLPDGQGGWQGVCQMPGLSEAELKTKGFKVEAR